MCYYSFSKYLKQKYGTKVRRVSLDAGFGCPHIDAAAGGGCIYCNENGFSDPARRGKDIKEQIVNGISGIKEKYGTRKFIAYFQNSTSTNADVDDLKAAFDSIKDFPEIVSLYISTRPDCVDDEKLDLIAGYTDKYDVWIEYGVQSSNEDTLKRINRGHTFRQSRDAIERTASKGINAGAHVILGLPGETREDMVNTARALAILPVSGIKLHVLHVLKNTVLEKEYAAGRIDLLSREEYIKAACDFLEHVNPECVIFRLVSDARREYLIAPAWINDKLKVIDDIKIEFAGRGTIQGAKVTGQ